ncbi:MAG: glutamate--tRNA ligase [Acidobacteriota bacterium]
MEVRVRFAPSPTGFLHIGGARTALFNWLFARHSDGVFILRIEDTDARRSSDEMVKGILEGMRWLGLDWDEGPYYQSQRLDLYHSVCDRLLARGQLYPCFCRRENEEVDHSQRHLCRHLPETEVRARVGGKAPFALRFKVPAGREVRFVDQVFGPVEVQTSNLEDFIVLRSDRTPTYHLCVVADDVDMGITHVIRGADHLSNTAKHVLLYQGLGCAVPIHAHLPLILGPDKKRLSKRHGATSVLEYREQGFLPLALRNYLALLGWSPGNDQEFFQEKELEAAFDLDRINRANAVFDVQKLEWMNGRLISALGPRELEVDVRRVLESEGLWRPEWSGERRDWFLDTVALLKSGRRRLTDFADYGRAFFSENFDYDPRGVSKYLTPREADEREALLQALEALEKAYLQLQPFTLESTEAALREIGEQHGLKAGKFIGAVRVALTGKPVAPPLFDIILTLGRERTVNRLKRVLQFPPLAKDL